MDQLSIFDLPEEVVEEPTKNFFDEDKADWYHHFPEEQVADVLCYVIGYIPENIKSPMEHKGNHNFSKSYQTATNKWAAYVSSIAWTIPHEKRIDDANGWNGGYELLKQSRDEKLPVKLAIWKRDIDYFTDLEVVEYLPTP